MSEKLFELTNSGPNDNVIFYLLEPPMFGNIYMTSLEDNHTVIFTEGKITIQLYLLCITLSLQT